MAITFISIRTPAWGVTFFCSSDCSSSYFNSHPRVGGDRAPSSSICSGSYFNSHPRVGGDSKNTQNSIQPFVHLRCFMRLLF